MKASKVFWLIIVSSLILSNCSILNEGDQIEIYTIPGNLNIYFGQIDTNKTNLKKLYGEHDPKSRGGMRYSIKVDTTKTTDKISVGDIKSFVPWHQNWVKVYNRSSNEHYLIEGANLKGKSPIILNNIKPGNYLIAVEPVEFANPINSFSRNVDPFLKPVALVSSFPFEEYEMVQKWESGEIKLESAIIYFFRKVKGEKGIIIIYCQENLSLAELENYYPEEINFTYDVSKLTMELDEKNITITEDEIPTIVNLLERGGKVLVDKGKIVHLVQIVRGNQFKIQSFADIGTTKKN